MNHERREKHEIRGKGLVPRLRFPEFRDAGGWAIKPLRKILSIGNGKDHKHLPDGDVPVYGSGGYMRSVNDYLYDGESVCIGRKGTIDKPAFLNGKFWAVDTLFYTHSFRNTIPRFVFALFQNIEWLKHNEAGGVPSLSKTNIAKIEVAIPETKEQQKIADCLSSLDALIAAQADKIDALKTHKKGLMQQLFPREGETIPRLRFPEFRDAGGWEERRLGEKDVASFVKKRISLNELDIESYVSTENLLPDFEGKKRASKLPPSGSFTSFNPADILVANIRPYLKKVWVADSYGAASNDVVVIRPMDNIRGSFLSALLKNDAFIHYVMEGAKGVKMPRGDVSLIKEYPLAVPGPDEQQKIADCLSSLDTLIAAQSEKLDALKTHKKGLMQQLFPMQKQADCSRIIIHANH
ncbi:MAG: restriction endonuclease subunit S [Porticoccaceae bacterium]|nr:restriction endonuclease subunit S [Porticoccaceae bacterium]